MKCRHCRAALALTLLDLGSAPPSNAYLSAARLTRLDYLLDRSKSGRGINRHTNILAANT